MNDRAARIFGLLADIGSLIRIISEAIASGDDRRVDEILAGPLRVTVAKARAQAEAADRFGEARPPDPS